MNKNFKKMVQKVASFEDTPKFVLQYLSFPLKKSFEFLNVILLMVLKQYYRKHVAFGKESSSRGFERSQKFECACTTFICLHFASLQHLFFDYPLSQTIFSHIHVWLNIRCVESGKNFTRLRSTFLNSS